MPRFLHSCFADEPIVEGRLGRQLGLVQLRLVRHVLVRIAALFEVGIVVTAEMSDGVRELIDARLSQRFREVVEKGGEKLTGVHEYDVANLQHHVTLPVSGMTPTSAYAFVLVFVLYSVYSLRKNCSTKCPSYDERL